MVKLPSLTNSLVNKTCAIALKQTGAQANQFANVINRAT